MNVAQSVRYSSRVSPLLLFAAICCSMAAGTSHAGMPSFKLPRGALESDWGANAALMGRPAGVRIFEAPGSVGDIAAQFLAQADSRTRLMGLPDGLLIMGDTASWLWSIRLRPIDGSHTQGVMSATDVSRRVTGQPTHFAWLPQGAQLQFDLETDEKGRRVRHQVYTHPDKPASFMSRLRSQLIRDRWQPVSDVQGLGEWRRDGSTLQFSVVDAEGGSGVVIHLSEQLHGGSAR